MIAHKWRFICWAGVKLRNKLHNLLLLTIWYRWSAKKEEDHDGADDGVDNAGDDGADADGADACGDDDGGDNGIPAGFVDQSDRFFFFIIWFVITLQ